MHHHCWTLMSRWYYIPVNPYGGTQEFSYRTLFQPEREALQALTAGRGSVLVFTGMGQSCFWRDWLQEQIPASWGAEFAGAAAWLCLSTGAGELWSPAGSCIVQLLGFTSRLAGAVLVKRLTHAIKALSHQPKTLLLASSRLQQVFPILELALISELGSLSSFFPHWVESIAHPFLLSLCSLLKETCSHFPCYFSFYMYSSQLSKDFNAFWRQNMFSQRYQSLNHYSVLSFLMERAPLFIILLLLFCMKRYLCFQCNCRDFFKLSGLFCLFCFFLFQIHTFRTTNLYIPGFYVSTFTQCI